MRRTNTWRSRYGECFVSFPSVIATANLEFEMMEVK